MNEKHRLLHIEDDPDWQDLVKNKLKENCQTTTCSTIEEVLMLLSSGRVFDLAAVDLTIERSSAEWQIKTPEDLILHLQSHGIGVVVLSGVPDQVKPLIEKRLGVKVIDKLQIGSFKEIIASALLGYGNNGD